MKASCSLLKSNAWLERVLVPVGEVFWQRSRLHEMTLKKPVHLKVWVTEIGSWCIYGALEAPVTGLLFDL